MWRYDDGILWKGCKVDVNAIEFQGVCGREREENGMENVKGKPKELLRVEKVEQEMEKSKGKEDRKGKMSWERQKGGGNQSISIHQISVLVSWRPCS